MLVGQVRARGESYEVQTHEGSVTVAKRDVAKVRSDKELRAALKSKAKQSGDSAFATLQLAKIARDYGLEPEMWRLLDETVAGLTAQAVA